MAIHTKTVSTPTTKLTAWQLMLDPCRNPALRAEVTKIKMEPEGSELQQELSNNAGVSSVERCVGA